MNPVCFLLVDDLEENLVALEALLKRDQLTLLRAKSGREALELLLKHDVALTLIDVQMPEMDGFELAELMRGTEKTRRIPIIFLTAGNADWGRRFRGYEAGAVDFILKPIEADILRSKAEVFFELYRQRQEVAQQRDELKAATEEISRLLKESRAQADALRLADKRKDEFLATLAHELRNPLAPIGNAIQMLRMSPELDLKVQDTLGVMHNQFTHLVRIVDDLLEISRITQGKVELRRKPSDLRTLIESAVATSRPAIESANHQLKLELPDTPLMLFADPTRIAQIFSNLLNNAARYTPPGGTITLCAGRDEETAVVKVRDTGVGIPERMLRRIFDLFTQVDNSLVRVQGGLGIGLTLVRNFVELHGGTIEAKSEGANRGSEFVVHLPLSPMARTPGLDASASKSLTDLPRRDILIVDDTRTAANMLSRLLETLGQTVHCVNVPDEALKYVRTHRPDIILSDIAMPGMDGYELARRLRQLPELNDVCLVALTGYGQESDRRRALSAGFDVHLVKPVDLESLKALLYDLKGAAPK